MFNVYKNQLSRQTGRPKQESDGSKNATHNMVYLYDACDQISDSCHQQLLRKMRRKISWTDGQTDRGKTVLTSLRERGYNYQGYIPITRFVLLQLPKWMKQVLTHNTLCVYQGIKVKVQSACPFTYCSTCFTQNTNHARIIERTLRACTQRTRCEHCIKITFCLQFTSKYA